MYSISGLKRNILEKKLKIFKLILYVPQLPMAISKLPTAISIFSENKKMCQFANGNASNANGIE